MATQKKTVTKSRRSVAAGSWLALLAATTLGDGAATLHAEVRAAGLRKGPYRLVVQSYDSSNGRVPSHDSRPIGSMQRAVTAEELQTGVHVNLLELRESAAPATSEKPMVVAWIEAGEPNLEFDARNARPTPGSVFGVARRDGQQSAVRISLNRMLAG